MACSACELSRRRPDVRGPYMSSGLMGISPLWFTVLTNHYTQPPWSRSQGSGHWTETVRALVGDDGQYRREERRGTSSEPQVRSGGDWGTEKSFRPHSTSTKPFPSNTENEKCHLEQSLCRASCTHQECGRNQEDTWHDDGKFCSLLRYVQRDC